MMINKIFKYLLYLLLGAILLILSVYLFNIFVIESKDPLQSAPEITEFITIDGEHLAFSEINNNAKTTILFIGGLSAWAGTWERVVEALNQDTSNQYNYISLDLPPFGFSVPDRINNYYRDTQAMRLKKFIDVKNLDQVILVGHSYGAGPVTEYAITNPTKVKKLILIDAVLNVDEPSKGEPEGIVQVDWIRNLAIGTLIHVDSFAIAQLKSFVHITDNITPELLSIYTRYFSTDGVTEKLSAWLLDYTNDPLTYASNSSEEYTTIPFPVRIIWGEEDTLTPLSGTDILLATIPDVKLTTLSEVGHIPMIEDYAKFDLALAEALTD